MLSKPIKVLIHTSLTLTRWNQTCRKYLEGRVDVIFLIILYELYERCHVLKKLVRVMDNYIIYHVFTILLCVSVVAFTPLQQENEIFELVFICEHKKITVHSFYRVWWLEHQRESIHLAYRLRKRPNRKPRHGRPPWWGKRFSV